LFPWPHGRPMVPCSQSRFLSPFPLNLFGKSFDMDFPKSFWGVFELLLLRNAQKRHLKKDGGGKEGTYLPHWVAICQIYVAFKKNLSAPCHSRGDCFFVPGPPWLMAKAKGRRAHAGPAARV
jgi:hypothetical protein